MELPQSVLSWIVYSHATRMAIISHKFAWMKNFQVSFLLQFPLRNEYVVGKILRSLKGDEWRRVKRIIAPSFSNAKLRKAGDYNVMQLQDLILNVVLDFNSEKVGYIVMQLQDFITYWLKVYCKSNLLLSYLGTLWKFHLADCPSISYCLIWSGKLWVANHHQHQLLQLRDGHIRAQFSKISFQRATVIYRSYGLCYSG